MSTETAGQLDLVLQAFNLMPTRRDKWDCTITTPPPSYNDVLFLAIDANFLSHSSSLLSLVGEIGLSYLDSRRLHHASNPRRNSYDAATNVHKFLPKTRHIRFGPQASKDFLFGPEVSSRDPGSVREELLRAVNLRPPFPSRVWRRIVIVTNGDKRLKTMLQQFAIDKERQVAALIDIPTLTQQILGGKVSVEGLLLNSASCPFALTTYASYFKRDGHIKSDGSPQLPLYGWNNPGNRAHYTLLAMMAALPHTKLKVFDPVGFPDRPERENELVTILGLSAFTVDLFHYPVEKRVPDEELDGLRVLGLGRSKHMQDAFEGDSRDSHWA
ncbi:hypothetical protein BDV97DRAFT_198088 [Delphinella strobiligena]|nr:hypothetical protein BDV97DRAFT_198088 [Delphinella strobiligena]